MITGVKKILTWRMSSCHVQVSDGSRLLQESKDRQKDRVSYGADPVCGEGPVSCSRVSGRVCWKRCDPAVTELMTKDYAEWQVGLCRDCESPCLVQFCLQLAARVSSSFPFLSLFEVFEVAHKHTHPPHFSSLFITRSSLGTTSSDFFGK